MLALFLLAVSHPPVPLAQGRQTFSKGAPKNVTSVVARFDRFIKANPSFEVHVDFTSNSATGSGNFALVRHGNKTPEVSWSITVGSFAAGFAKYRYQCDGTNGIDILDGDKTYDRLPAVDRPFPGGRLAKALAFPYAVVRGSLGQFKSNPAATLLSHTASSDTVSLFQKGPDGSTSTIKAVIDAAGKPVELKTDIVSMQGQVHEDLHFSGYRLGGTPSKTLFDTRPPVGYIPFALAPTVEVLATGAHLPSVRLIPGSNRTLASLADPAVVGSGPILIAFLDGDVPNGVSKALGAARANAKVTVVLLTGSKDVLDATNAGKTRAIFADEKAFDAAGVSATPQFYLMRHGVLVQAWQGIDFKDPSAFPLGIKAALAR